MTRAVFLPLTFGIALSCREAPPSGPKREAREAPEAMAGTVSAAGPASAGAASQPRRHGDLVVIADVAYADDGCDDRVACPCAGVLRHGENALRRVGVTPEALRRGVPCVIGDYDGNGVADLAVAEPWDEARASRVMVLFFDRSGLSATAMLPKRVRRLGQRRAGAHHVLFEPGPTEHRAYFALQDHRFTYVRTP